MLKVCIVTTSLANGGAERSSALLSQMLFSLGYKVHVLVTKNQIEYPYSGTLFNLEKEINGSDSNWLKTKRLKSYFNKHKFNFIIDNRVHNGFLKEFLLYRYVFRGPKVISVVRSCKIGLYIPKEKILAYLIFGGVKTIVAVSDEIKESIKSRYNFKNVVRIYNPVDIPKMEDGFRDKSPLNYKFILFFGRIEERVKNLSLLIASYKDSCLPQNDIKLVILGSGPDLDKTEETVKANELTDDVIFIPFAANPFSYVKEALFTVLTSYYEGFPRVIIESLAMGVPVVSVDCKSGPKELIIDKFNGLLVKNHDISALTGAMNTFVENTEIYAHCKKNTKQSVSHLQKEKIALQWKKYL